MSFSALDSELLGPLFATQPMRDVWADQAMLEAMVQVETALAHAQRGMVPAELAPTLAEISASQFDLASLGALTAIAGVPVIAFVKAVQGLLPKQLERDFHKGATSQDIADTALMLTVRTALDIITRDLDVIVPALANLARKHRLTPCAGRTYGQHAAPVSFGYKVAVWATGIAEVGARLPSIRARLLSVSLAGPVGTLAGMAEDGPKVLERFAFALQLAHDPIAWHTRRARIVELGAWLAMLIGACAKMATDIAHLASTEVSEVAEPFVKGRGGSSAMPHKHNPVGATLVLAAHSASKGHVVTLLDAMAAAHERPAGAWHAEWLSLPQLFGLASGALHETRSLAEGLDVDTARMRSNLDLTHGLLFADAVARVLAPRMGRENAHEIVAHAATLVRSSGRSLRDVLAHLPQTRDIADLDAAFDLMPAVQSAALWTDQALQHLPLAF